MTKRTSLLSNAIMAKERRRLPRYQRVSYPPPMWLMERDKRILEAIHAYDGMLGFSQIQRMFFSGKTQAEERMKLLYQHCYVNRPNREQRRRVPEMIYWLAKRGADVVSGLTGTPLDEFKWRNKPRWFQVEHDLAVTDFRLDVWEACRLSHDVTLVTWVPEGEFCAYPDRISYSFKGRRLERYIRPDGFFVLNARRHRIRYLLEIDRSTEDNPRFFREKILPGLAYLKSDAYEKRFGRRSGRWLVVTTSERRMGNMLSQAKQAKARGLFYFTTYDQAKVETILFSPIWRRADREDAVPLLFID